MQDGENSIRGCPPPTGSAIEKALPMLKSPVFTLFSVGLNLIRMNLSTPIRRGRCGRRFHRYKEVRVYSLVGDTLMGRWKPLPISINIRYTEEVKGVCPFPKKFRFIANIKREKKFQNLRLARRHDLIGRHDMVGCHRHSMHINLNRRIMNAKSIRFQGLHLWNNRNVLLLADVVNWISGTGSNGFQLCTVGDVRNRKRPLILHDKICCKRRFRVQCPPRSNCNLRTI